MGRILCVLAVLALGGMGSPAAPGQDLSRYLVTLQGPLGKAVENAGGRLIHQYHLVPGAAIELPARLAKNPNVLEIVPDIEVYAIPRDSAKPPKGGTRRRNRGRRWNGTWTALTRSGHGPQAGEQESGSASWTPESRRTIPTWP